MRRDPPFTAIKLYRLVQAFGAQLLHNQRPVKQQAVLRMSRLAGTPKGHAPRSNEGGRNGPPHIWQMPRQGRTVLPPNQRGQLTARGAFRSSHADTLGFSFPPVRLRF